jgi:hypothetical protein
LAAWRRARRTRGSVAHDRVLARHWPLRRAHGAVVDLSVQHLRHEAPLLVDRPHGLHDSWRREKRHATRPPRRGAKRGLPGGLSAARCVNRARGAVRALCTGPGACRGARCSTAPRLLGRAAAPSRQAAPPRSHPPRRRLTRLPLTPPCSKVLPAQASGAVSTGYGAPSPDHPLLPRVVLLRPPHSPRTDVRDPQPAPTQIASREHLSARPYPAWPMIAMRQPVKHG